MLYKHRTATAGLYDHGPLVDGLPCRLSSEVEAAICPYPGRAGVEQISLSLSLGRCFRIDVLVYCTSLLTYSTRMYLPMYHPAFRFFPNCFPFSFSTYAFRVSRKLEFHPCVIFSSAIKMGNQKGNLTVQLHLTFYSSYSHA